MQQPKAGSDLPGNVHTTLLLAPETRGSVLAESVAGQHARIGYSPYGNRISRSPVQSRTGFNGQLLEPHGGYHLGNGHRLYNPLLRRFHSPDRLSPFAEGGLNAYAYCQGDPVNFTDPTGQKVEAAHIASFLLQSTVFVLSAISLFTPVLASAGYLAGMRASGAALAARMGPVEAFATGVGLVTSPLGLISTALQTHEATAMGSELMWVMVGISLSAALLNFGTKAVPTKNFVEGSRTQRFASLVHGRRKLEEARRVEEALEMSSIARPTLASLPPADVPAVSAGTLAVSQRSIATPVATGAPRLVGTDSARITRHARQLRGELEALESTDLRLSRFEMKL